MSGQARVSVSRKITISGETKNQYVTLGHLKALVNLATVEGYPDDSLVVTASAISGMAAISVRDGDA